MFGSRTVSRTGSRLYCLDYDFGGREQTVDVVEAATGTRLDSRIITNFTGGTYLVWQVTGHVQIRVTRETLHRTQRFGVRTVL